MWRYDSSFVFEPFGVKILFDARKTRSDQVHHGRVALLMSGSSLKTLDVQTLYKLTKDLVNVFWMKGSRIDCCFDDYERIINPHEVKEWADQGHYTSYRGHESFQPRRRTGQLTGDTIAFGKRGKDGGGKYLCCYDKKLESKRFIKR